MVTVVTSESVGGDRDTPIAGRGGVEGGSESLNPITSEKTRKKSFFSFGSSKKGAGAGEGE